MDTAALRAFGLILAVFIAGVFGTLLPWLGWLPAGLAPWLIAAGLALFALAAPRRLAPVHAAWLRLGHMLGWVNTRVLLGLVFYGLILPIGLLRRLARPAAVPKRGDPACTTYRVASRPRAPADFEKPY